MKLPSLLLSHQRGWYELNHTRIFSSWEAICAVVSLAENIIAFTVPYSSLSVDCVTAFSTPHGSYHTFLGRWELFHQDKIMSIIAEPWPAVLVNAFHLCVAVIV